MKTAMYSRFVRGVRALLKITVLRKWTAEGERAQGPAVYVAHHQNLRGPVRAAVLLPEEVRIWVLHVFCRRKACFDQYYGYTFTQRLGWPRPAACAAAGVLSLVMPCFLRGLGVIPVCRGSREILQTMELSQEALLRGESLLICPDRDYACSGDEIGDIYKGFLRLERSYCRKTGKHLAFVPLSFDGEEERMIIGEPVRFTGETTFAQETDRVAAQLRRRINMIPEPEAVGRINMTPEQEAVGRDLVPGKPC